jgi:hypothetical protein
MEQIETLATKFLLDLKALPEESMGLALLGRRLSSLEPRTIAKFLDIIYKLTLPDKGANKVLALLVNPADLKGIIGAGKCRQVYMASIELELDKVSRLFTDLPPHKAGPSGYDKEAEARMESTTLGERRALSKLNIKDTIDRLLSDPDPMVINNILNNPRATEREIIKIVSKRPNSPNILKLVATHRVWSKRYAVKLAIASNPYSLPRVSIALLELLLTQDLKTIKSDGNIHPQVRLSAGEIIRHRTGEEE